VHDGGSARPGSGHAMSDEREALGLALDKLDAERAKIREAVAYLETLTRSPLRDRVLAILRGEE
jgi:hypothetical protein